MPSVAPPSSSAVGLELSVGPAKGAAEVELIPYGYARAGCGCLVNRWFFGAAVLAQTLALAGSFFGWPNMSNALQARGYFASSCAAGEALPCAGQGLALNRIFTAASVPSFIAPLLTGMLSDAYGPRVALLAISSLFAAGAAFAIASEAVNELLYPAFVLFASCSTAFYLPLFSFANLFPGFEGLALALLNGSFDAAAIVYLIMARLLALDGASVPIVFGAYLAGPCFLAVLAAIFLWPRSAFEKPSAAAAAVVDGAAAAATNSKATVAAPPPPPDLVPGSKGGAEGEGQRLTGGATPAAATAAVAVAAVEAGDGAATTAPPSSAAGLSSAVAYLPAAAAVEVAPPSSTVDVGAVVAAAGENRAAEKPTSSLPGADSLSKEGAPNGGPPLLVAAALPAEDADPFLFLPLRARPFLWQVLSPEWLFFLVFFVINLVRYTFYISSVDAQLNALGQVDGQYSGIFALIALIAPLVQIGVGFTLDRLGLDWAFAFLWAVGMALSGLNLIGSLQPQIATFVAFAFFRALHWTTLSTFVARVFGYANIGVHVGLLVIIGGAISTVQTAFFSWAISAGTGGVSNFTPPNVLVIALEAANIAFPIYWIWRMRCYPSMRRGGRRCC